MNEEEKHEAQIITGDDSKHVTAAVCVCVLSCLLHLIGLHHSGCLCSIPEISAGTRKMDATDRGAQSEPLLPTVRAPISGDKYLLRRDEYFRTPF